MIQNIPGHTKRSLKVRLARSILFPLLGLGVAVTLTGCDEEDLKPTGEIRVLHTSSDAPPVNVKLNGDVAISNLDYAQSSGYTTVDAKDYTIVVEGIIPSGNMDVITVPDFPIEKDDRTTIIATDNVTDITPLVVSDSAATPAGNEVALRVVHASKAADDIVAAVDVYVTDDCTGLNGKMPAFTFAFKEDVDAGALAAGEVRICIAPAGGDNAVYDSGPVDLAPFAGSKLLIVAVDTVTATEKNTGSPVKLLVATDTAYLTLLDTNTTTGARVVHASPDAGEVEVWAASDVLGMNPVRLIADFDYLDVEPVPPLPFFFVPSGDYVFSVGPNTNDITDSVFISGSINLAQGSEYTVVAAGRVASDPAFRLLLTEEDLRPVVTQASVKVIHAAPAAGTVQVYVTPAGVYSADQVLDGTAGAPLLPNFAFGDITGAVAVPPDAYDIRVVAGGMVAINEENVNLAAGSVSTVIARGPNETMGGTPTDFGLVVLTN